MLLFPKITLLLNYLESQKELSRQLVRPRRTSLKHPASNLQLCLLTQQLYARRQCMAVEQEQTSAPCLQERSDKDSRRCKIRLRNKKESNFSELTTDKQHTRKLQPQPTTSSGTRKPTKIATPTKPKNCNTHYRGNTYSKYNFK